MSDKANKYSAETNLIHGGTLRSNFSETSEGLFLTSGFVYDSAEQAEARFKGENEGYVYSRFSNPTISMFEERMRLLEGAEDVRATSSGMAAVAASLLCFLNAGDHVVAAKALFGSCRYIVEKLLPRFGINTTLVDGADLKAWEKAITPNTRAFFLESPTNPALQLVDIAAVAKLAKGAGARLVVDNVFATVLGQKPLELGADVVVYSATKHIDGQGRCLGGVVLSDKDYVEEHLHDYLRQTGPALSPFNAWVLLKGLETLQFRVEKAVSNAGAIATFLEDHPKIEKVYYPGLESFEFHDLAKRQMSHFGNMIAFHIKGKKQDAFNFLNQLDIIKISNNLGDVKSLITHPKTTTHKRMEDEDKAELKIDDTLIRFSVGCEGKNDLINDLTTALKKVSS